MEITDDALSTLQAHFNTLLRLRAAHYLDKFGLVLPDIRTALNRPEGVMFRIPGMGYVHFQFHQAETEMGLVVESAYTQISGSGQRHWITVSGTRLIEENF
jgi:hypothetical protein